MNVSAGSLVFRPERMVDRWIDARRRFAATTRYELKGAGKGRGDGGQPHRPGPSPSFRYAGTVWVFGRRGTSRPGLVAGAWAQGALLPAGLGEGGHLEAERQARPYADAREEWRVRLPRDVYPEALRALCDHARRRGWEAVMARCADLYALVRQGELDLAAVPAATGGGW